MIGYIFKLYIGLVYNENDITTVSVSVAFSWLDEIKESQFINVKTQLKEQIVWF